MADDLSTQIDQITSSRRLRRGRRTAWSRALIAETALLPSDLILPIFLISGANQRTPIETMPGVMRYSVDQAVIVAQKAAALKIPLIALFPAIDSHLRDEAGSEALNEKNLVCQAARAIKEARIDVGIMADIALDPYTSHGHDGIMREGEILNDETVEILARQALVQARAGCDVLSPSDMMDGRVGFIRRELDQAGFRHIQILSYSNKYASAFYGPFRDAIGSAKRLSGDKKTYQMDPANTAEAYLEAQQDISEGADMLMVKPGLPYLDILYRLSKQYDLPVCVYQVSGEYAMIQAAAERGYIDRNAVMMESLLAFKRAGARAIISYFALEAAELIQQSLSK